MFTRVSLARLLMTGIGVLMISASAWAQPLGTFRWQQQPYCNILTLNVIFEGGNYTLDGTDDLCGAPQKASVTGIAYLNPDLSIGLGLTIVAPDAAAMHLNVTFDMVSVSGPWSDSAGNTGTLVYTPAAGVPGSPRPATSRGPTRVSHAYDLAPGATSPPITVPPNIPVSLMGVQLVSGQRGVGHASILSIPGANGFIEWVSLHSPSAGGNTVGFSGVPGTLILFIDWSHCVRVEVAGSAGSNQIQVHNDCPASRNGVVTLTY
jgi:hypothetical protein